MANDRRNVINGVAWPDGTIAPIHGMYLGVEDFETLQFFELPEIVPSVTSVGVTGANGITSTGGPITSTGSITVGLGDITPTTVSTGNTTVNGNLSVTGSGRVVYGDFSSQDTTIRTSFQSNVLNNRTVIVARPNGGNTTTAWAIENSSSGVNCAVSSFFMTNTTCGIQNNTRGTGTPLPFYIFTGAIPLVGFMQDVSGNVSIGGDAALATTATSRFLYINGMPGKPTGTPMAPQSATGPQTGKSALTVDMTNDRMYFYNGTNWQNTNAPDYQEFTATAGQTVFNTTIGTIPKSGRKSYLQVFSNGIFQQEGTSKEYTVTGPNQITFNNGVAPDADVIIYSYA